MIRYLNENDKETYLYLCKAFYGTDAVMHSLPDENYERTFCELMRSDTYAFCVIIEKDEKTAGYCQCSRTWSQEAGGEVIWIEELFILPAYRGQGLGKEFFRWLFANKKAARYRLEVEPENEVAYGLYKKLGFRDLPYGQLYLGD